MGLGHTYPLLFILRGGFYGVRAMSTSTLQRLLHETLHVDDGVADQLRPEKEIQLKDLTAAGGGKTHSTPSSTVHNIFLFVNAFNLVLSFEMTSDGASCLQ